MNELIRSNIESLKLIAPEQWRNILETDYDGVFEVLINDDKYKEILRLFPRQIRDCVLTAYGFENVTEITSPLQEDIKSDIKMLALIKEFQGKLIKDVTLEYLRSFLEENETWNHVEQTGKINKLPLALFLLNGLNLEKLHLCLLVSSYERYSYQDYQLFMDLEGVNDPLVYVEYKDSEQRGLEDVQISADAVNEILNRYERSNNTGMSSTCLKILRYNEEVVIFIRRESQRGGLRTFEEYIVGWNADLIVLRFGSNFKTLKVRAVEAVKDDVYLAFSSNIVKNSYPQLPITYIKTSLSNSKEVIDQLIQLLLTENDIPGLELYEIELQNTAFAGRPWINIKKNSTEVSLNDSFNDNTQGFTLASIIAHSLVSKIKVKFLTNRRDKHIFNLNIFSNEDSHFVVISGQGGGIRKRQQLIQLLNDACGIRILEAKGS